jgi:hypothetical protein
VRGIRNDQLFEIDNVSNKEKIDQEETHKDPIHPALRKGDRFIFHAYLQALYQ